MPQTSVKLYAVFKYIIYVQKYAMQTSSVE